MVKHLLHKVLVSVLATFVVFSGGCMFRKSQRYTNFITQTPLKKNQILILGFLGGREPWNNDDRNVRKLALKLRAMNDPSLCVETLENRKRSLALRLITNAFDANHDGKLDDQELASVRLIIYGQSFGAAAVVKLATELNRMNVPVALTVQVDSVGHGDRLIPANVATAANLYQENGWIIRGEPEIRAEDPAKTAIIGNFKYDYSQKQIDISKVPFMKKVFRIAHTRMEYDPDVWVKVETLVMESIKTLR